MADSLGTSGSDTSAGDGAAAALRPESIPAKDGTASAHALMQVQGRVGRGRHRDDPEAAAAADSRAHADAEPEATMGLVCGHVNRARFLGTTAS